MADDGRSTVNVTALSEAAVAALDVVGGTKNATLTSQITAVDTDGKPIDPELQAKAQEIVKQLDNKV